MSLAKAVKLHDYGYFELIVKNNSKLMDTPIYEVFFDTDEIDIRILHFIVTNKKKRDTIINVSKTEDMDLFWKFLYSTNDKKALKLLLYCLAINGNVKHMNYVCKYNNEIMVDDYMFHVKYTFIDEKINKWLQDKFNDIQNETILKAVLCIVLFGLILCIGIILHD